MGEVEIKAEVRESFRDLDRPGNRLRDRCAMSLQHDPNAEFGLSFSDLPRSTKDLGIIE
jgi:hypothetical protein